MCALEFQHVPERGRIESEFLRELRNDTVLVLRHGSDLQEQTDSQVVDQDTHCVGQCVQQMLAVVLVVDVACPETNHQVLGLLLAPQTQVFVGDLQLRQDILAVHQSVSLLDCMKLDRKHIARRPEIFLSERHRGKPDLLLRLGNRGAAPIKDVAVDPTENQHHIDGTMNGVESLGLSRVAVNDQPNEFVAEHTDQRVPQFMQYPCDLAVVERLRFSKEQRHAVSSPVLSV